MAKIISVCSEKGGAGKTTATLNIARGLAKKGKKVLVIDLDQQGNASRALGYIKDGKYTISEVILQPVRRHGNRLCRYCSAQREWR